MHMESSISNFKYYYNIFEINLAGWRSKLKKGWKALGKNGGSNIGQKMT